MILAVAGQYFTVFGIIGVVSNMKSESPYPHLMLFPYVGLTTFNYKQVAFALGATGSSIHRAIALLLAELAFDGDLIEVSPGKYKSPQRNNVTTGVFVRRANGKDRKSVV